MPQPYMNNPRVSTETAHVNIMTRRSLSIAPPVSRTLQSGAPTQLGKCVWFGTSVSRRRSYREIFSTGATERPDSDTGFSRPFSGASQYEYLAPTQATDRSQINQAIGQLRAEEIARGLGLRRENTLTEQQFLLFISGMGVGGDPASAKLVDESVRILTNTTGRPLYSDVDGVLTPSVLSSYGLFVNEDGLLMSPANLAAPTRQVNEVIQPGGYMGQWMRANGATASLIQLYRSAYTVEAVFGNRAQQISEPAQLVTNTKEGVSTVVGMSMAPALWLVNFALIYTLNPDLAAFMPAYWTPIPPNVVKAILRSPDGQVPYSRAQPAFPPSN